MRITIIRLIAAAWLLTTCCRTAYPVEPYRVTAYCHCKECCGPNAKGITASGKPAASNWCGE